MAGNGRRRADEILFVGLLCGKTIIDAAREAGIGETTARRRVADPAFRERLAEASRDQVSAATSALTDASVAAVRTLRGLLDDGPPAVRLGSARAILELADRWRATDLLDERMSAVEAALRGEDRP